MAGININEYNNKYSQDYSSLFSGMTESKTASGSGLDLTDYAAIKNGSYGKLMKAYYKNQQTEKSSKSEDNSKKLTLMRNNADALKKSANALLEDSLWEKKKITKKDEKTGKETEEVDYDWDAITKAVKAFVSDYNNVIEEAGKSDTRGVLRNASWMVGMTEKMGKLLGKAGISIGKGNKLEVDEEKLKNADISVLKTLFTGYNSFADKVAQKANSMGKATTRNDDTYTRNGSYADTLSKLVSNEVNEEV